MGEWRHLPYSSGAKIVSHRDEEFGEKRDVEKLCDRSLLRSLRALTNLLSVCSSLPVPWPLGAYWWFHRDVHP